jgi:signal transduction histidine kinase
MQQKSTLSVVSHTARFIFALLLILVLSIFGLYQFLKPPLDDILLIAGFLFITTVFSAIAGYAAYRLGWMNRSPNISTALLGSYALACLLTFINVWLTARLMFADQHDLLLGTILLIFAGAIAMALGYLLSSSFIERIHFIDQAAKKIANGNLSIRVPVEGRDELADLANSFNQMASQLQESAENQKQLETLRKELIAWISHDLQTPLASISAIIEALADDVVEDPQTEKRYLTTAKRSIDDLSHLIDDLFQMAQIDAGGLPLNYESVSISDLISDILESFTELAKRNGVILKGSVGSELEVVPMDPKQINRVLNNLIKNAMQHSKEGGYIAVGAHQSGKDVIVEVRDNGKGIPPEDLEYIFDPFFSGEKSRRKLIGGSGLGLTISKGIIEAHGGNIEVKSDPNQTCFTFYLPLTH